MNLINTYNQILTEALLDEKRVEFDEFHVGMMVAITDSNLLRRVILIDSSKFSSEIPTPEEILDSIVALIILQKVKKPNTSEYSVFNSAAEKGYGLTIYELAMQSIFPNQLVSDRDWNVTSSAKRMYDYFYKGLNPNVVVEKIPKDDPRYVHCDNEDAWFLKCGNTSLYDEQLYNSKLSMRPNELKELFDKYNSSQLKNINLNGIASKFFERKYKKD